MTRCRCAECGAVLASKLCSKYDPAVEGKLAVWYEVHPCGACLQEARAEGFEARCELRDGMHVLQQEGRD